MKQQPLKRILLAEDNLNDVELTLEALKNNNIVNGVDVVRDGVSALDYLFRRGEYASRPEIDPALVLLDIKMPRLNGLEVLEQLKTDSMFKRVPIVMLTSSREEPDLKRAYDLGVNAYVVKPVDFKQFVHAVQTIGAFWAVLNEAPPNDKE